MVLLDSIIEGALLMPSKKDSDALIAAYVRYMATGEEPNGLRGYALAQWVSNLPAIESAKARSENGAKGGRPKKRTQNLTQNLTKNLTQNQTQNLTDNQTPELRESEQIPHSLSLSSSPSSGMEGGCNSTGEGVPGEGFAQPTVEEAKAYFAANGLMGDPEAFWAYYDSQGWRKSNGLPISSWTSAALKWGVEERAREASKPPDQQRRPVPKPRNAVDPDEELERFEREMREKYDDWGEA